MSIIIVVLYPTIIYAFYIINSYANSCFHSFFSEHLLSSPKTKPGMGERPPFQVQLKPLDGSALDPPRPLTAPNRKAIKQLLLSTNDNSNNSCYSNNNSSINNYTTANVDTITAGTPTGSTTMNRVKPSKRAMSANTSTTTATTRTRPQSKSSARPNSVSSLRPTTTPITTTTRKHNSTTESKNQTTADVSTMKQNLSTITIDKQQQQLQQQQIQLQSQQKQQLQETDEECGFQADSAKSPKVELGFQADSVKSPEVELGFQADSAKSPEVELGFDPRRPSVFAASMQSTKLELLRRKSSIDATLAALTLSPSIGSTNTGNGSSKKIIQRNNSGSGRYPSGQLLRKLSKNEKSNSTNSSNSKKLCIQMKNEDNHSIGNSNSLTSSRADSISTLPSIEHI